MFSTRSIAVLALMGLVLAGCGMPAGRDNATLSNKAEPLRIGLNPWIGNGLYAYAQGKGFFTAKGLTVEFVNFDDGATGKQLLMSGNVDAISLTPETVVILAEAGAQVKAVAMTDTSIGADGIIATADIRTVSDLKGKRVAFETGSPSHFLLSYLLDKEGLSTEDLIAVNEAAPDAGASFVAGKVDAAVTWEPWLSKAAERDGGHLLASSKEHPILPALCMFRTETLMARPTDVRLFVQALFEAQADIATHEAEAVTITAKHFKLTDQEVREQLPTFRWFTLAENQQGIASGEYSAVSVIQKAGDLWLKLGLITKNVQADQLVDPSFLGSAGV